MRLNDLPTEMLDKILGDSIHHFLHPATGSRVLMSICRRWHDIITSRPNYWTYIWILIHSPQPARFDWILWRLAVQLVRCQRALIDVTWEVHLSKLQVRRLMEMFGEYAPFDRWRSLSVIYHSGHVPGTTRSLSPLGVFSSLEKIGIWSCRSVWFLKYINSTLPPSAPLRELQCPEVDILLDSKPGAISNILHSISKLHASRILLTSNSTSEWSGLPTNITDLTLEYLPSITEFDFSHVKTLSIQDPVSARELALNAFSGVIALDIAFDEELPVRRLSFPVLLELRIRGEYFYTLSGIDAPRLQVLVIDEGGPCIPRQPRPSLEHAVKLREYALRPTRELEIGVIVSAQTLRALLDYSPTLEKLTLHMMGTAHDREMLRLLLFPSASPEDMEDQKGDDWEGQREVESNTLRHGILPSDEEGLSRNREARIFARLPSASSRFWGLENWRHGMSVCVGLKM